MGGTVRRWAIAMAVLLVSAPAAAADDPLELTILETVNLPWQGPEAILVANVALGALEITVAVEGQPVEVHRLPSLLAGSSRSVTWDATVGTHACKVTVRGHRGGKPFVIEQRAKIKVVPALELQLGEADVDLGRRKLRFHANQRASFAELTLYDMDGRVLHRAETELRKSRGSYALTWPRLTDEVARIAVRVFSTQDTWADAAWAPIDIEVPHAPILFDAAAEPNDAHLDAAYAAAREQIAEHRGVPGLALYVVGFGDQANGKAVARSAKHVARYLKKRGKLGVPVRHAVATRGRAVSGKPGATEVHTILSSRAPVEADWQHSR